MILRTVRDVSMMLHISAMDNARKVKFSSYIHLPSTKKFQYQYGYEVAV